MWHPETNCPPDLKPIEIGEVWENPVNREIATILERPWDNPDGGAVAELTARVGARVVGEHRHPALVEQFTVLEGELTVKRDGQVSILHTGETGVVEAGVWHDWWNASDRDARVRVQITPGERFVHMIETFFGLARLGHTDGKGMPYPLQLALIAREFSDVVVFRSPPLVVQRVLFAALAPTARWRGYRATYPQLSRSVLAPRGSGGARVPMTFFDSREPFSRPDLADLDRVYRFAWQRFTQPDWDKLDGIYRNLPGWIGYDPVPWWFGKDERKPPHLAASVEPPGLQVTGVLPIAEFTRWHETFMEAIKDFPAGEPNQGEG